jgi:hypothetical protein
MNSPIAITNRYASRSVTISKLRGELALRDVSDLTNQHLLRIAARSVVR